MGKSSPKAPAAPDPNVVAGAQTQQNVQTAIANAALNRVNQNTPWGNLTYTQTGTDANGIPQYTQNISLSPEQQRLMQSNDYVNQGLANLSMNHLNKVFDAMEPTQTYAGAPAQVTNVGGTRVQTPWDAGELIRSASYGKIQDDLDLSKVPELIGGDKLAEDLGTQRDALYRQQAAFLDPQWRQDQSDLENKLIQQGIAQNSDAWNRAVGDFSRNKEFAYSNARNQAITGGGAEQSRLFGLGLASNQNAFNQALGAGQFHNAAQAQGFGQSFANAQLNNSAQGQMYDQLMRSQGTQFDQNLANANLQNQGRNQYINESNYLRNQPLNELTAIRSGSQVTSPQFSGIPQALVGNTDITGAYNNQYQGQLANYNARVAGNNALTGGLFGLGAAALGAPGGFLSGLFK